MRGTTGTGDVLLGLKNVGARLRALAFGWSRCLSVFVDQAAEDVGSFNGLAGILVADERVAGAGWTLIKGSVWPMAVVVRLVFGQDGSELTFMEDQ